MKALSTYLETAQDFQEGHHEVENLRKLYEKDAARFERMWQELFKDEKSLQVKNFEELLESKGLYVQYEKYASQYEKITEPNSLDLRIYPYDIKTGKVACLKVTVHEER